MKILIAAAICALPVQAFADCIVAGNFKGVVVNRFNEFTITEDRLSPNYIVNITENSAAIIPGDLICQPASESTAICVGGEGNSLTVEVWTVDAEFGKVTILQTRSMIDGLLAPMNGSKLFVGDLTGSCP